MGMRDADFSSQAGDDDAEDQPDVPRTILAFDRAIRIAEELDDPVLAGVTTPEGRLKVKILQQSVGALRASAMAELGPEMDVGIGFNAADGD